MFDRYNIVDEDDLRTALQRPSRYVAALKTTPAVAVSGEFPGSPAQSTRRAETRRARKLLSSGPFRWLRGLALNCGSDR